MKKLNLLALILLVVAIFTSSCKKNTLEENNNVSYSNSELQRLKLDNEMIADNANSLSIHTEKVNDTIQLYNVIDNPCTNEQILITGHIDFTTTELYVKDYLYHYDHFHYDHVIGTGLTTGSIYKGIGHATTVFIAEKDPYGSYQLVKEVITNKIVFKMAGTGNSLTSTAFYHGKLDSTGTFYLDKVDVHFNTCK